MMEFEIYVVVTGCLVVLMFLLQVWWISDMEFGIGKRLRTLEYKMDRLAKVEKICPICNTQQFPENNICKTCGNYVANRGREA